MNVDRVEGPLVVLQDGRGGHCFVVLGADDDDDQIALLCGLHNIRVTVKRSLICSGLPAGWRFHLAEEALHEVDLADAPQLLLKNVNLRETRGAVVRNHKNLRYRFAAAPRRRKTAAFLHTCVSKPLCRSRAAKLMTSFTCLSLSASYVTKTLPGWEQSH